MSESFALVALTASRTIAQAHPVDALSLEGIDAVELSLVSSDAAQSHHHLDIDALHRQCELALHALGVTVRVLLADAAPNASVTQHSAQLTVRIDEMQMSTSAAIARLKLAAEGLKSMRSVRPLRQMEAHESVITWQGMELGVERGNSFSEGASAALAILLEEFSVDFRKATLPLR